MSFREFLENTNKRKKRKNLSLKKKNKKTKHPRDILAPNPYYSDYPTVGIHDESEAQQ